MNQNGNEFINIVKSMTVECIDSRNTEVFSPEMYYLLSLYIIETVFDFYNEDIFKFIIYNGYKYFKDKPLNESDKCYILLFEREIKYWNHTLFYTEIESLLIEILKVERSKIVERIKNEDFFSLKKMDDNINNITMKIRQKYSSNSKMQTDLLFDDILDIL